MWWSLLTSSAYQIVFLYTERLSACSSNNNNNNNNEEEDLKADVRSGEVSTYSRPGQLIIKLRINNKCWQCCLVGIVHTISYCRHWNDPKWRDKGNESIGIASISIGISKTTAPVGTNSERRSVAAGPTGARRATVLPAAIRSADCGDF